VGVARWIERSGYNGADRNAVEDMRWDVAVVEEELAVRVDERRWMDVDEPAAAAAEDPARDGDDAA
jgi:hypothetical protein